MKFVGLFFIAVALLQPAALQAQDAQSAPDATVAVADTSDATDKPYATIVARNMFGLVPIPPPPPPEAPPVELPPKIILTGIMTIFGRDQALFKTTMRAKPGQPAHEESFVLSEGERQDDIEVVKINRPDNMVTFNNHGTVQELTMGSGKDSGGAGGPGMGNPMGGFPRPGLMSAADRANLIHNRQAEQRAIPTPGNLGNPSIPNSQANMGGMGGMGGVNFNGGNGGYVPKATQEEAITPEQQVILIEAQRMKYLQNNNPIAPLLPPTPLTPRVIQESSGSGSSDGPSFAPPPPLP